MAGLKDTVAGLAEFRRQAEAFAGGVGAGESKMTEVTAFGANPGALRMLAYAPRDLAPGAALVVVLHGCTQRAEAYASAAGWLTLADRHGFVVVAPEQTPSNNPNRCFNWYEPGDAARGGGEVASIRAMVAHAVRQHGIDPQRVFVTGLSAGGAMTAAMLATYPDVFAAGAIIAGLPYGVADNVQAALGAMFAGKAWSADDLAAKVQAAAPSGGRIPRVSIWHGDADHTVRPHNAVEIAKQWTAVHGLPVEPDEMQAFPGRTRALWRSAAGEVLVESNLVQGLGHGTPLATGGPDGVGAVAPHMLEAGVSSSQEILRFWGFDLPEGEQPRAGAEAPSAHHTSPSAPNFSASGVGEQVMSTVSPHVPAGVQDVIAKALKTAGLLK